MIRHYTSIYSISCIHSRRSPKTYRRNHVDMYGKNYLTGYAALPHSNHERISSTSLANSTRSLARNHDRPADTTTKGSSGAMLVQAAAIEAR